MRQIPSRRTNENYAIRKAGSKGRVFTGMAGLIISILATSCGDHDLPALGHHFENGLSSKEPSYIYVGYKQRVNGMHMTSGGIDYLIGLKYGKDVVYIGTMDPAFSTPEGYSLKTSYLDIINGTGGRQVRLDYGWGWTVTLPSGWMACFTIDPYHPSDPPDVKRKVEWFCKKKLN